MNKKLIYSLIAGTMFTLTSCDDFLDVQPASGFTPGTHIFQRIGDESVDDPYLLFHDGRRIVRK